MTADEARRRIDEKIAEFERCIRQLNTQRNDLAPISQLPPELLSRIFGFVVGKGDHYSPAMQFNFSFVSYRWRETALGAPELWTNLTTRSLAWAGVMLERSKMAPLTVHTILPDTDPNSAKNKFVKDILVNHGSHLQDLSLIARTSSLLEELLKDTLTRVPLLNTLHLSGERYLTSETSYARFPVGWLAGAQRLRELQLESCSIDWQSMPFSNLTNLRIHRSPTLASFSDFVDALRQATVLESLDLSDSLPSESAAADAGKLTLPRLQTLRLSSPFNNVASVVGLFVVPAATTVSINCTSSPERKAQVSSFGSSITALVSTLRSNTGGNFSFRELSLSDGSDRGISFTAWSVARSNLDIYVDDRPHLFFATRVSPPLTASIILFELVHSLPVSHLGKLSLYESPFSPDTATLVKSFGSLPHLSHIYVQGTPLHAVTKALQHKTKNYETSRSNFFQVAFPKLTTLEVDQGIFSDSHLDGIDIDDFQDMLMERCERKAPLHKLSILDSYDIYEDAVELLREIVVDVDWDEYEQEYGDDDEDEDDYDDEDDYAEYDSDFDSYAFGGLY